MSPTVLIVEDESESRDMLSAALRLEHYDVLEAANGLQAFHRMESQRPDLVLLDMHMPVMDGWSFRTLQMRDSKHADVPVIGLSAVFDPHDVALKLGIRCLSKPVDMGSLLAEVRAICGCPAAPGVDRSGPESPPPDDRRLVATLRGSGKLLVGDEHPERVDYEVGVYQLPGTRAGDDEAGIQRLTVSIVAQRADFVPPVGVPLTLVREGGGQIELEFRGGGYLARTWFEVQ